jgi:cytochrome c oxidase subunit 4
MADHVVPARHYVYNFTALMVLMILTVVAAAFDLGAANLPIALAIAITKATLIVLIFMNVRNGTHLVWIFAGAGFVWLLIMISFTITDFAVQYLGTAYTDPLPGVLP